MSIARYIALCAVDWAIHESLNIVLLFSFIHVLYVASYIHLASFFLFHHHEPRRICCKPFRLEHDLDRLSFICLEMDSLSVSAYSKELFTLPTRPTVSCVCMSDEWSMTKVDRLEMQVSQSVLRRPSEWTHNCFFCFSHPLPALLLPHIIHPSSSLLSYMTWSR